MSRKAKTLSDSKSLKAGMSPKVLEVSSYLPDCTKSIPLMILQKIQADIFAIGMIRGESVEKD